MDSIPAQTQAENLLILSDLHLNEGRSPAQGNYGRREDFFYDLEFFALLRHHQRLGSLPQYSRMPWRLILNGDTFDFVQVLDLPAEGEDLERVCGITRYQALDGERRRFGLGSTARECAWKMRRIAQGHPFFFAALGWFVAHGNSVVLIKGNHDTELHWPEVQQELRRQVGLAYDQQRAACPDWPLLTAEMVEQRIQFEPWFYYDSRFQVYIEHGGQYEPSNHIADFLTPLHPLDPESLDLAQGLLLTRYFYNRLEEDYPYVDNVRPATQALSWMLQDGPVRGSWVFARRLGDFIRAWWRTGQEQRRKRARLAQSVSVTSLPTAYYGLPDELVASIWALGQERAVFTWKAWGRLLTEQALLGTLSLAGLGAGGVGIAQFFRRRPRQGFYWLLAAGTLLNGSRLWGRLVNRDDRVDYMPMVATALSELFRRTHVPLRAVFLGHTHIARREYLSGIWMVNSGTWIPMLMQRGSRWSRHLILARMMARSEDEGEPELLEWDPVLRQLRRPPLFAPLY